MIRQDPAPGSTPELGTKVTLAVENRTPAATPTPIATPTPVATPTPAATAVRTAAGKSAVARQARRGQAAAPRQPEAEPTPKATAITPLPKDFVFAGATSGRLYRWASPDAKAAGLTSPEYRLETPTKTDDGYVAVQVRDAGRRLVWIAADGKTVDPIAEGGYYRPAYSPSRGLLAVIAADGQGDAADAGTLCVMDPHDTGAPACAPAPADGRRVGRPSWAPNGRSVLVLAAGPDGDYNELLTVAPNGADPTQWAAPTVGLPRGRHPVSGVGRKRPHRRPVADRAGASDAPAAARPPRGRQLQAGQGLPRADRERTRRQRSLSRAAARERRDGRRGDSPARRGSRAPANPAPGHRREPRLGGSDVTSRICILEMSGSSSARMSTNRS